MSETQADQRSAPDAAGKKEASAAELAARVAGLVGEDAGFRGGELPLWNRLGGAKEQGRGSGQLTSGIAWCIVLTLGAVALLRFTYHDAWWPLALVNSFTLYLYLPAYVVFAYAVATRRALLSAVCVALVACHWGLIWPDVRGASPATAGAVGESRPPGALRIYFANVHARNQNLEGLLSEARSYDPDVIILAEMQRWWWTQMISRNPLPDYPYGTNLARRNAGDIGVFSRVPVRQLKQIPAGGRFPLEVDLAIGDETLRLIAVHSPRPTPEGFDHYNDFWNLIQRAATSYQGPVVVIGDFNTTQYSRVYRRLQEGGLRSAHEDRGRGLATTWPNIWLPVPLIRIDQVFLSGDVECLAVEEGVAPGSDHQSLIVDVLIRASSDRRRDGQQEKQVERGSALSRWFRGDLS